MTETIEITTSYHTVAVSRITLKEGKTWNDVMDWYIKWDTMHVQFKGETDWVEYPLDSYSDADSTDWKRPISVAVHPVGKDGVDYAIDYAGEIK